MSTQLLCNTSIVRQWYFGENMIFFQALQQHWHDTIPSWALGLQNGGNYYERIVQIYMKHYNLINKWYPQLMYCTRRNKSFSGQVHMLVHVCGGSVFFNTKFVTILWESLDNGCLPANVLPLRYLMLMAHRLKLHPLCMCSCLLCTIFCTIWAEHRGMPVWKAWLHW